MKSIFTKIILAVALFISTHLLMAQDIANPRDLFGFSSPNYNRLSTFYYLNKGFENNTPNCFLVSPTKLLVSGIADNNTPQHAIVDFSDLDNIKIDMYSWYEHNVTIESTTEAFGAGSPNGSAILYGNKFVKYYSKKRNGYFNIKDATNPNNTDWQTGRCHNDTVFSLAGIWPYNDSTYLFCMNVNNNTAAYKTSNIDIFPHQHVGGLTIMPLSSTKTLVTCIEYRPSSTDLSTYFSVYEVECINRVFTKKRLKRTKLNTATVDGDNFLVTSPQEYDCVKFGDHYIASFVEYYSGRQNLNHVIFDGNGTVITEINSFGHPELEGYAVWPYKKDKFIVAALTSGTLSFQEKSVELQIYDVNGKQHIGDTHLGHLGNQDHFSQIGTYIDPATKKLTIAAAYKSVITFYTITSFEK
jgi:hypothetical protein